jgi:hypothetical protein
MYQTIPLFKLFFSHLPIGSKKFQFGLALLCVLLVILCNFSAPFMLWRPLKYVRGVGGGGGGGGAWPWASPAGTPLYNEGYCIWKLSSGNLCTIYYT